MFRAAIVALVMLPFAVMASDAPRVIEVTGQGEISAEPDMAKVMIGVRAVAVTAGQASDQTSTAVAGLIDRLADLGIPAGDVQTSGLSLSPQYDGRQTTDGLREIVGYQSANTLSVRVTKLDQLSDVLTALLDEGANELNGLTFGLQDPDPLVKKAQARAVTDALETARILADAAGVTLGPALRISSGVQGVGVPLGREVSFMTVRASVPVATGNLTIRRSVTVQFAIAD